MSRAVGDPPAEVPAAAPAAAHNSVAAPAARLARTGYLGVAKEGFVFKRLVTGDLFMHNWKERYLMLSADDGCLRFYTAKPVTVVQPLPPPPVDAVVTCTGGVLVADIALMVVAFCTEPSLPRVAPDPLRTVRVADLVRCGHSMHPFDQCAIAMAVPASGYVCRSGQRDGGTAVATTANDQTAAVVSAGLRTASPADEVHVTNCAATAVRLTQMSVKFESKTQRAEWVAALKPFLTIAYHA